MLHCDCNLDIFTGVEKMHKQFNLSCRVQTTPYAGAILVGNVAIYCRHDMQSDDHNIQRIVYLQRVCGLALVQVGTELQMSS